MTTIPRTAPFRTGTFVRVRGTAPFELGSQQAGTPPRGAAQPAPGRAPAEPAGRRCRILVVDDDDGFREALAEQLEEFPGTEVEQAAGGSAALAKVRGDHGFGLVFLDIAMPGLDGPAVYRNMRQSGVRCRIVLMSAHYNAENQARAAELGTQLLDKMAASEVLGRILLTCGDDGTP